MRSCSTNGRGIERDHLRKIFEPFAQVDRSRDALNGGLGLGLGLAIVQKLVERDEGEIHAESDGPGCGSTFIVELPAAHAAPPPEPSRPRAPSDARHGIRVLVVDDNADVTELLTVALALEGFETAVAHDAETAIRVWRTFSPHAAVLDIGLPERDGYDLAPTLRAEHGKASVLIAATGYGQRTDRARAFDCHLVKPVGVGDLAAFLDERVVSAARVEA